MHYRGPRYKAIDLFAGAGGLTEGLKQAGFDVVGAVENNTLAVETYEKNHPTTHVWSEDIIKLSGNKMRRALGLRRGELVLLAGCPPCQGFSTMRTGNGSRKIEDPQNDLIYHFLRFVGAFRPRTIMMENVPGLAADERFNVFRSTLERIGYRVDAKIQDVADHGVPQRRHRLILLAGRGTVINFAKPLKRKTFVRQAFRGLAQPHRSKDNLHNVKEKRSDKVMAFIKDIPKDGGSRLDLGIDRQLECHKKLNGYKDVYGRMAWDDVAPTITTGCFNPSKGRFLHPVQNRCITLREAALLQSFPPRYSFSLKGGKTGVATMIGNALPPKFIRRHATKIRQFLMTMNKRAA